MSDRYYSDLAKRRFREYLAEEKRKKRNGAMQVSLTGLSLEAFKSATQILQMTGIVKKRIPEKVAVE